MLEGLRSSLARLMAAPGRRGARAARAAHSPAHDPRARAVSRCELCTTPVVSGPPVLAVCLVGFHHSQGPELEEIYPPVLNDLRDVDCPPGLYADAHTRKFDDDTRACLRYAGNHPAFRLLKYCDLINILPDIPCLSMPDGAHKALLETTLMMYPNSTLYGVSIINAVALDSMVYIEPSRYTRDVIQKALVVISELPLWEPMIRLTRQFCVDLFDRKDFRTSHTIMALLYDALNQELLSQADVRDTLTLPDAIQHRCSQLMLDRVPLALQNHVKDTLAVNRFWPKPVVMRTSGVVQEYVLKHLSKKSLMIVFKALLLETRVLVWGTNPSLVSSVVVYFASLFPLRAHQYLLDLLNPEHCFVLPYAPLEFVDRVNERATYLIGTTNAMYLESSSVDVVLVCPHETSIITSKEHHFPPTRQAVCEIRNKHLRSCLQLADVELRLLIAENRGKDVGSRLNGCGIGLTNPLGHNSHRRASDNCCTANQSPSVRRSSFAGLPRAASYARLTRSRAAAEPNGPQLSPPLGLDKEWSVAQLKAVDGQEPAEQQICAAMAAHTRVKLTKGFRADNLPRLMWEKMSSYNFRIMLQGYLELLLRLAAFGGGEHRSIQCLEEVVSTKMYSQFNTDFWTAWMKTRSLERFMGVHALPQLPRWSCHPPRIGVAEYEYANGDIYRGSFKRCLRHGHGRYFGKQVYYEGQWKDDRRHGKGVCQFGDSLSAAETSSTIEQRQALEPAPSALYSGEWKDDARNGSGMQHNGPEVVVGEFLNNRVHGQAIYRHEKLQIRAEGAFVDGYLHGKGIVVNESGYPLSGRESGGSQIASSNSTDSKEHSDSENLYHRSAPISPSASREIFEPAVTLALRPTPVTLASWGLPYAYSGEWEKGRFHGYGTLQVGGDFAKHIYKRAPREPQEKTRKSPVRALRDRVKCIYRQGPDSFVYSGEFYRGAMQGRGVMLFADGTIFAGTWKENARVRGKFIETPWKPPEAGEAEEGLREEADASHKFVLRELPPLPLEAHRPDLLELERGTLVIDGQWLQLSGEGNRSARGERRESGVLDAVDLDVNWDMHRVGEWRYTGGISIESAAVVRFHGFGQIYLASAGATLEAYWSHGTQQTAAALRQGEHVISEQPVWLAAAPFGVTRERAVGAGELPVSNTFFSRGAPKRVSQN